MLKTRSFGGAAACLFTLALLVSAGSAGAKSLYLIANINANPSPIRTYDIQTAPTYVAFQATQNIPSRASGAVGLAIDTDNKKLFATYEGSNVIQLVDATNFAVLGTTTAPGASNLAGLVVDQGNKKLYAVDRNTNHLYVYSWTSATNT
ncbi:MAG: YncE family protein, partial [Caldimonas sp.]